MQFHGLWIRTALVVCVCLLGAPAFAEGGAGAAPALHDCGKRACGEWKQVSDEKGDRTCRKCKTPQCKTVDGKDALAGTKTETECYQGHGKPPADD